MYSNVHMYKYAPTVFHAHPLQNEFIVRERRRLEQKELQFLTFNVLKYAAKLTKTQPADNVGGVTTKIPSARLGYRWLSPEILGGLRRKRDLHSR